MVDRDAAGRIAAILAPDLLYLDDRLEPGCGLATDAAGVIRAVGRLEQLPPAPVVRYRDRALFPGFVNSHSHAFQRLIRGRTLAVPANNPRADFWSWRTRMYEAALALSPDDVEAVTAFCYLEMLRAGITSVAEFHYLHHAPDGTPYADRNLLALKVLAAARRVGIRVTLLPVAYHRGGFGRPAEGLQRRFLSPDLESFLHQVDDLRARVAAEAGGTAGLSGREGPEQQVGLAAHSVRAVPEAWLRPLKAYAAARGIPAHVHANEQRGEVAECSAALGLRPTQLLAREGFLDKDTVVVHGTHLSAGEKALLARSGARVSVCPTTERDLGDGILDARGLVARGVPLCLGSDSHVQIDFFAEMRCLEGHERLRRLRRNVLLAGESRDGERSVVPALWAAATEQGAPAMGAPVGRFAPGLAADGFTVDLGSFELEGAGQADVPGLLLAAGGAGSVREVLVGGREVVSAGGHPGEAAIRAEFRAVCRRLWGGA